MNPDFAKAICRAQARGQFGPFSVTMAREIEQAIGDDPDFAEEIDRIREAHETNMRRPLLCERGTNL